MKFEDLCKYFLDRGYSEYPAKQEWRAYGVRCFSKRLPPGTPCKCNDFKISWHANLWPEIRLSQNHYSTPSAEIEIFGEEVGGMWFGLKAYSFDLSKLDTEVPKAEHLLQEMWRLAWEYEQEKTNG